MAVWVEQPDQQVLVVRLVVRERMLAQLVRMPMQEMAVTVAMAAPS